MSIFIQSAGLLFCERDAPVTLDAPSAKPNDPLYPQQTNLKAIKVPDVWQAGQFGSNKVLAFLLLGHPCLSQC